MNQQLFFEWSGRLGEYDCQTAARRLGVPINNNACPGVLTQYLIYAL